jgi:hypothetical protein
MIRTHYSITYALGVQHREVTCVVDTRKALSSRQHVARNAHRSGKVVHIVVASLPGSLFADVPYREKYLLLFPGG